MRKTVKAALTLAATMSAVTILAGAVAAPASAKPYPPPSVHLLCTAPPTNGALHGSVCALPFGQTTAPNSYSATIAANKVGLTNFPVTFTLTAGSLPPGLSHVHPVRDQRRHHRKPDQGWDVQLHHQGGGGQQHLHPHLPDHRHRAGSAGPADVRPVCQRRLPGKRNLRAARRRDRPALPGAPSHQPPGRRHAQRRLRRPAPRPDPAGHVHRLRRHRQRHSHRPGRPARPHFHRARHRRPRPAPVPGLHDRRRPEPAADHQRQRRNRPR